MSDLAIWGRRARKLTLPTCFVFMRGFFNSYKTKRTLSYYLFTWGGEQRSLHRSFNPTARTCASVHGFVLHRSSINNAGFVAYGVEQEEPWEINMGNEVNTHKGKKRVNEHDNVHPHRISHVHSWGGFISHEVGLSVIHGILSFSRFTPGNRVLSTNELCTNAVSGAGRKSVRRL